MPPVSFAVDRNLPAWSPRRIFLLREGVAVFVYRSFRDVAFPREAHLGQS